MLLIRPQICEVLHLALAPALLAKATLSEGSQNIPLLFPGVDNVVKKLLNITIKKLNYNTLKVYKIVSAKPKREK